MLYALISPPPLSVFLISPIVSSAVSLACASIVNGEYRYTIMTYWLWLPLFPPSQLPSGLVTTHQFGWSYCNHIWMFILIEHMPTYIAEGLRDGFRIGFYYRTRQLKSRKKNHPTYLAKPSRVTERILVEISAGAEISAGHLLGPISHRSSSIQCISAPWTNPKTSSAKLVSFDR